MPPNNIWKKYIDLRLFCVVFGVGIFEVMTSTIISESLAVNLEKVRQSSVWQTVPKFWFILHWYLSLCNTYKNKTLRNNKKDKSAVRSENGSKILVPMVYLPISCMVTIFSRRCRHNRRHQPASWAAKQLIWGSKKWWWGRGLGSFSSQHDWQHQQ